MTLSRRSFLKVAGLTVVAAAGAAVFAGCTAASYLQIEFADEVYEKLAEGTDPSEKEEAIKNAKDMMAKINTGLKLVPLVGVSSMKKEDLLKAVYEAIKKTITSEEDPDLAEKICNMIDIECDEDGVIKAEDKFYGAINIVVILKAGTTSEQAAVLGTPVV